MAPKLKLFLENCPTSDTVQSLQGVVPGQVITKPSTGGEPGITGLRSLKD